MHMNAGLFSLPNIATVTANVYASYINANTYMFGFLVTGGTGQSSTGPQDQFQVMVTSGLYACADQGIDYSWIPATSGVTTVKTGQLFISARLAINVTSLFAQLNIPIDFSVAGSVKVRRG